MKAIRRILAEPGTPYGRLALAGLLGLAAAAATIGLLAGSGYILGRAAARPGLGALVGILAAVEVLAFLRGPLRYAERLVGHDAALRALGSWRVWLYDCLTPRVPAALAGWRSGDLLASAIDDVDTLQDLYLRTLLPVGIAAGAATLGLVVVGLELPVAAVALGIPLAVACTVPPFLAWHGGDNEAAAALGGALSAQVVDAIHGAPDLLAFGADGAMLDRLETMSNQATTIERRQAGAHSLASLVTQLCAGAAVLAVLAVTVSRGARRGSQPRHGRCPASGGVRDVRGHSRCRRRSISIPGCRRRGATAPGARDGPRSRARSGACRRISTRALRKSRSCTRPCAMGPTCPGPWTAWPWRWRPAHAWRSRDQAGRASPASSAPSCAFGPSKVVCSRWEGSPSTG